MSLSLVRRVFNIVYLGRNLLVHSAVFLLLYVRCLGLQLDIKLALPVQGGSREYIYFEEKITWNEAATFCKDEFEGGSLAKIDSQDFQVRLINAFEAAYGTNPFSADYWTGVFQPSQGDFRWASDCSTAYYTSHLEKTWDSGKTCFKFHKDDHDGIKDGCSSKRAFMCEKPLPAAYSCSTEEIFTANSLGTETAVLTDCEVSCDIDDDCWMVIFTPPYGCMKIAYNTEVPAAGVEAANSPVTISGKYCIEVSMNSTSIIPSPADSSDTPIVDCSAPPIIPTLTTTITVPPISPTPTLICATETVFSVSVSSCLPQTLTENIYHTVSCATETLTILPSPSCPIATETRTILPSPSCPVQISTVSELASCVNSPCVCSPTISTLTVPSFCSSIAPTTTLISPSTSVNAEQQAEEIAQNLTINEKSTSAYKRKLTSARDDRPLSKTMGYLGICFVTIPLGLIVLIDIKRMVLQAGRSRVYIPEKKHPPLKRFVQIWKHK